MESVEKLEEIIVLDINDRPVFADLFMALAFTVNIRSPDPATKHGSIIVDQDNSIVSLGYNGAPAGCKDSLIPWDKRPPDIPNKYQFSIHSEENAILLARRDVRNCTLFVTGIPCYKCIGTVIQSGISKVVYGPQGSFFGRQTEYTKGGSEDQAAIDIMLEGREDFSLSKYTGDVLTTLLKSLGYFLNRVGLYKGQVFSALAVRVGKWKITLTKVNE